MGGCDKPLRLTDILLYPWDGGLDVCVDLTGCSSLTQIGMVDFVLGFSNFLSLPWGIRGEHGRLAEADPDVLHDSGHWARAVTHIFNGISFAIAKGSLSELQCTSDGPMGRPAVDCSSVVGVKFRHNLVRDILIDMCSKFGIMVRKEAPIGFFLKDEKDLRPADLLLFNWLQGKDLCLDVTGISPFAGMGASSWAHRVALNNVMEKKKRKYTSIYSLQFGVGWAGGSEAILHSMNRLIEACKDDVGLSMLLMDFKNAFNLVDRDVMLREVRLRCPAISRWIRDSFSLSFHAWYLDDDTIVGDTLVVGKVLELIMEDGLGCGLHLNKWRLATLPFAFGGLGVYSAGDVLNSAFLASRLQYAGLQTKLLWHTGIVSPDSIFDDALSVFNTSMDTELLSNLYEIAALKLIKKMADIHFTRVTKNTELHYVYLLNICPYGLLKGMIIPLTGLGRFLFLGWDKL
nr:hypothetical protein [Tanacetum cinerariifolium]